MQTMLDASDTEANWLVLLAAGGRRRWC